MAKIVSQQHITGDKGVASFHLYCASHTPYILWRPESINDFGIDGEVELTMVNANGKNEATGEICKIQIKSTLKGSYIHRETDEGFEFKPTQDDVDYWNKHSLGVILIIYDDRNDILYAKKVNQLDLGYYKKNIPITIGKSENLLENGKNDFVKRFSSDFKSRIDFDIKELLASNIHRFSKLPIFLYSFNSPATDVKEIVNSLPHAERPLFYFKPGHVYTIIDPTAYPNFCHTAIDYKSKERMPFKKVLNDLATQSIAQGILTEYFKSLCREKKISFNKEYRRYYFYNHHKDFKERIEYYNSKGKKKDAHRTVVTFKQYKTWTFHRHLAFGIRYILNEGGLFLIINPQYLFTSDGREPLEDKAQITALTNYLTAREYNQQVLNHTHFIFSFLASGRNKIVLSEIEGSAIELQQYWKVEVPFGIPLDDNTAPENPTTGTQAQQSIFPNEN